MRARLLILLGLALAMSGLGLSCTKQQPSQTTPTPPAPQEQAISETKSLYTQALGKAKDWQSNATLTRVFRIYNGTLTPSTPAPLTFAFGSLAEPNKSFEVEFQGEAERTGKVDKRAFELAFIPIDTAGWQADPDSALKTAEDAGGREFREQHLAGYKLLQQLAKTGDHPLQWYFRYDTGDGSQLRYEIWVNGASGAVDNKKESNI